MKLKKGAQRSADGLNCPHSTMRKTPPPKHSKIFRIFISTNSPVSFVSGNRAVLLRAKQGQKQANFNLVI
jgi:UDP-2,3-diacylglucosamine pyrophosphatase LpxH